MRPMEGVKKMPPPMPVMMPWVSIRCQYCVLSDIVKMPRSWRTVPMAKVGRNIPASSSRPEKAPMKKVSQTWIEPIQLIVEGVSSRVEV